MANFGRAVSRSLELALVGSSGFFPLGCRLLQELQLRGANKGLGHATNRNWQFGLCFASRIGRGVDAGRLRGFDEFRRTGVTHEQREANRQCRGGVSLS